MHIYIYARLILVLSLLSSTRYVSSASLSDDDLRNRTVLLGYGYSSDSKQVTNQACFNVIAKISDQTTRMELSSPVSSSNLQKTFGVDLSVEGGYEQFSTDAKAEYLRSIQEDEASISLNYYVVNQEEITINMTEIYNDTLTDFGKKVYHDEKKYFGLKCGDYYIASYDQGAVLFMGLNIVFNSIEEKGTFQGSIDANYGSFAKVASKIQSVSNENKISGTVQIRAHQFGGDSSDELMGIMNDNTVVCNIKDLSECNKVIQKLLSYAKIFGNQILNGKGLKALGSFKYVPIERLGLEAPKSMVTPEVSQYRKDLAFKLAENRYYVRKLLPLVHYKYPLKLKYKIISHFMKLFDIAKQNVNMIMNNKKGAAKCFNLPEKCKNIKTRIFNKLTNITSHNLTLLNNMKYYFSGSYNGKERLFYNTGEDNRTWVLCNSPVHEPCNSYQMVEMIKFEVTEKSFEYQFKKEGVTLHFNGSKIDYLHAYQGTIEVFQDNEWKIVASNYLHSIYSSPFFFKEYNSTIDAA